MIKNIKEVNEWLLDNNFITKQNDQVEKILSSFFDYKNFFESVVKISGTNGKGSVGFLITNHLSKNNIPNGWFKSPHYYVPNERIQMNSCNIPDLDIIRLSNKISMYKGLSFFDKYLIIALLYFYENNIKVIVIEAGVGAKFDTTAVIKANIAVLTYSGLDHFNIFKTKRKWKIALDKIYITNNNSNFYTYDNNPLNTLIYRFHCYIWKSKYYKIKQEHTPELSNVKIAREILINEFGIETNIENSSKILNEYLTHSFGNNIRINSCHNIESIKSYLKNVKDGDLIFICLNPDKDYESIMHEIKRKNIRYFYVNLGDGDTRSGISLDDAINIKIENKKIKHFIGTHRFFSAIGAKYE